MKHRSFKILMATTCLTALLTLTACGMADRVAAIGKVPEPAPTVNPYNQPGYKPVSQVMPPQDALNSQPNSLWQASHQTFFKDERAKKIGDILTVTIAINDAANLQNATTRDQEGTETQGLPNFLGFAETGLAKVLPTGVTPSALVGMNSKSTSVGNGQIQRSEAINLTMAATIVQLLQNGNFVIQGRQQVNVNYELRDLKIQGIIRPEDILDNNSISYDKIAEARITYGGKGNVSDIQQPRYGQQFFDAVFPF